MCFSNQLHLKAQARGVKRNTLIFKSITLSMSMSMMIFFISRHGRSDCFYILHRLLALVPGSRANRFPSWLPVYHGHTDKCKWMQNFLIYEIVLTTLSKVQTFLLTLKHAGPMPKFWNPRTVNAFGTVLHCIIREHVSELAFFLSPKCWLFEPGFHNLYLGFKQRSCTMQMEFYLTGLV